MFETTDELLKQIRLGEDSSLELENLEYKSNQVSGPHRNIMADELAAMANAAVKEPARRDIPQFSMQAVFEAVVNAVAHRDYSIQGSKVRLHIFSDRLELFSPGAISNTMTIDSLSLRQASRNELLTSLLARCPITADNYNGERKYIMDRRGEGVPIILYESEVLSGKRPEYRLLDGAELMLTIFAANPPFDVE